MRTFEPCSTAQTAAMITALKPNEVFVFGSNKNGVHGKGAALLARQKFGAKQGEGIGRTGQCYAIPTRAYYMGQRRNFLVTLDLDTIGAHVADFISYAKSHPELTFLVTPIGCGLAGYRPDQIAPLFRDAAALPNVILPAEFKNIL
jgi:hypothetical protein